MKFYNPSLIYKAKIKTEDGSVFMWGVKWTKEFDPSVELGLKMKQFSPKQLESSNFGGKKILMGSNGKYHAIFVSEDHAVWSLGYNNLGQLGNGE